MRQRCRLSCSRSSILVYVSVIALFTICNILAMILISRSSRVADHPFTKYDPVDEDFPQDGGLLIGNLLSGFAFHFNHSSSRTDNRRVYIIHDSVVVGNAFDGYSSNAYVTLATQCSVDKLHMLLDMADAWRAPMSVAIFVPGMDFYIAKVYIAYLRLCSPVIRTNATFHFLYHRDMAPPHDYGFEHAHDHQAVPICSRAKEALPLLLRFRPSTFRRWWQQALHPQNHLRNVARHGIKTQYHFLTDIDILPVAGLSQQLDDFLSSSTASWCSKCVYVVPTYEMPEILPVPRSKAELLERIARKQSRPFHAKVFIHNQFATNHSQWEKIPDSHKLEAPYRISNYEFFYEPFYVARANVPLYDERFVGYGFTRNTQVFEMHLAGFDLWVLNPAFAVHRGVQNKRGRGQWREKQNILNRKHFARFKNELAAKYRIPKNRS